jgi:hypothetical protein
LRRGQMISWKAWRRLERVMRDWARDILAAEPTVSGRRGEGRTAARVRTFVRGCGVIGS